MLNTIQQPISKPEDIYLVLLPKVHLLDLAGPAQVLTHEKLPNSPRLHYVSYCTDIISAQAICLSNIEPLPVSLPNNAWIIILGYQGHCGIIDSSAAQQTICWLKKLREQQLVICTVCSGALLAAKAGIFDARECTTHHSLINELEQLSPTAKIHEDRLFVRDKNIWSSAGVSTGIDLSLHLVSKTWGHSVANDIARDLVLYHRRDGHQSQDSVWLQYRNHINHRVHKVQEMLAQQPTNDWCLDTLAASVNISSRHLSRLFLEATGLTINGYLQQLRLAIAEQWLLTGKLSVDLVAEKSGFGSTRQFRRVWSKWRTGTPGNVKSQ